MRGGVSNPQALYLVGLRGVLGASAFAVPLASHHMLVFIAKEHQQSQALSQRCKSITVCDFHTHQGPRVAERGRQQADQLPDVGHQPPVAALAYGAECEDGALPLPPVLRLRCGTRIGVCDGSMFGRQVL